MTIIDVEGLSIGSLSKDTFAFLLAASYVMNNYYPERVKRICIINAPFWFSGAWKVCQYITPETLSIHFHMPADLMCIRVLKGCFQRA